MMLGHVLLVVAACSSKRDELPSDPVAAAKRVVTLATSCDGLSRALDLLSHSAFHGRALIGLVDEAVATAGSCEISGGNIGAQLARARRADARPSEALAALAVDREPAIRIRRAELLDRLGRTEEALHELDAIDEPATKRLYAVAVAAHAARFADAARIVADAPVTERPSLAHRAAADAPLDQLDALALGPELATTVADRLEAERGPAAALAARERAAHDAPDLAENHDALARAQIAAGKIDDALASWERAVAIAPQQGAYRIAPIRALVIAGKPERARKVAADLAAFARTRANDVELLVTASAGAAVAGDTDLASALARAAHDARPGDGRLAFLLAEREAEAGHAGSAAERYVELLVCGTHGRAWHRHEVAAKLVELDHATVRAALDKPRSCAPVDAGDLAGYVDTIRKRAAIP